MEEDIPEVTSGEEFASYFGRSKDFWLCQADELAEKEGVEATGKVLKMKAREMAEDYFKQQTS